jgi:hypothetical protein
MDTLLVQFYSYWYASLDDKLLINDIYHNIIYYTLLWYKQIFKCETYNNV